MEATKRIGITYFYMDHWFTACSPGQLRVLQLHGSVHLLIHVTAGS